MEHRGEILKAALKEFGVTQRGLAKRMGKHPNTITNYIDRDDLPDSVMLEIGILIGCDFTEKIPALAKYRVPAPTAAAPAADPVPADDKKPVMIASQAEPVKIPESLPECQLALLQQQTKYIQLLEAHVALLQKVA